MADDTNVTVDMNRLKKMTKGMAEILVGYPDGLPHNDDGIEISELAEITTYGSGNAPARPFLEPGMVAGGDEIKVKINAYFAARMAGGDGKKEAQVIGSQAKNAVFKYITSNQVQPPTSAATNAAKGKGKGGHVTLIDTGALAGALTFVVRDA